MAIIIYPEDDLNISAIEDNLLFLTENTLQELLSIETLVSEMKNFRCSLVNNNTKLTANSLIFEQSLPKKNDSGDLYKTASTKKNWKKHEESRDFDPYLQEVKVEVNLLKNIVEELTKKIVRIYKVFTRPYN